MRILHAIHDFLPRHRAGSEIYACELAREQRKHHDVFVLAAEYDPATAHGTIRWRAYQGLTVVELVNNWEFQRFDETYTSERINAQLRHVLDATAPDVLHVHNLLNLSFDLPRIAQQRGIGIVATLHDYTLVCPSGGQRVHVSEAHVCETIDAERCARCFGESTLSRQMAAGRLTRGAAGRALGRAGLLVHRLAPKLAASAGRGLAGHAVDAGDIRRRLAYARHVLDTIDLFVAPSPSIGDEFVRLGAPPDRVQVSDYGFVAMPAGSRRRRSVNEPLRIGFVGTLVWHKGAHVLIDAARALTGSFGVHIHGDTTVFPEYATGLRKAAAGSPVTFHDGFEHDHAGDVYGGLDVLVVPSLWPENSPLVIHEAFMHGLPVVGARIGGVPGLVRHAVNGLLYDPFSVESLHACLQQLIDDPELVERLAAGAPSVKSIEEDAREWDARYRQVSRRSAALPEAVTP
jgi:glycosyltransferase involved in cell wall biosynthesis